MELTEAYTKIRDWYKRNVAKLDEPELINNLTEEYRRKSRELINYLPEATSLSDLEMRAILGEIIYNYLEWAYHETDGDHKMSEYAKAAFETLGVNNSLSDEEKEQLRSSPSWRYLSFSQ